MTDETYTFISDVKVKGSIARSGGRKGKSRRGCSLPSDILTSKEKRKMNGDVVSISMDRPMSYQKFQTLSKEVQKDYIQNLIDNYCGTTSRIAELFKIPESQVKKLRQDLNIISRSSISDIGPESVLWNEFMKGDEFLKQPMTWERFRSLDKFDQQAYLDYLFIDLQATQIQVSTSMFGLSSTGLYTYVKNHGLTIPKTAKGQKRDPSKFSEFIKPFWEEHQKTREGDIAAVHNDAEEIVATPAVSTAPEVKYLEISFSLSSFDEIAKILPFIPSANSGKITITFGY